MNMPLMRGMDNELPQIGQSYYTDNRHYYAEIGDPKQVKKMFSVIAYPIFIKRNENNPKQLAWFNFHYPIKSVQWYSNGGHGLYVTLNNNVTHEFSLKYLK